MQRQPSVKTDEKTAAYEAFVEYGSGDACMIEPSGSGSAAGGEFCWRRERMLCEI